MIRKSLRFNESDINNSYSQVNNQLSVGFKPGMTKRCRVEDVKGLPPTTDFPIERDSKFVRRWLNVDFYIGEWRGEFGYLLES